LQELGNISFWEYIFDIELKNYDDFEAGIKFYQNYGKECDGIGGRAEYWADINYRAASGNAESGGI
jgi:hypothetical protein